MGGQFGGSTAMHYAQFRRDVPEAVVRRVVASLGLSEADRILDLGCGAGQSAIPFADHVGGVVAADPEPDMLDALRSRAAEKPILPVLAADTDIPVLAGIFGPTFAAVTIANALHWMDAHAVFRSAPGCCDRGVRSS